VSNQRKNYLIDKKFQLGVIYKFLALSFVNVVSFYMIVLYFFNDLHQRASEVGLDKEHIFFSFLNDQNQLMNYLFIIVGILNVALIVCVGIYYSHKVAGPLYRLSKFFQEVNSTQDLSEVKVRDGDYVGDLQDSINEMSKRLNK